MKGIKVSQEGVNALTAEEQDLLYTTEATSLKVLSSGIITFNFGANVSQFYNIPHNLGYVPVYRVFFQVSPAFPDYWYGDSNLSDNLDLARDPNTASLCLAHGTSQDIEVTMRGFAGFSYKAKYYIFEDRVI